MARWRLTQPHYLNVPDNEWEYKEQDPTTGREMRHRFPVPRLLNPDDPSDFNYREDRMVVVATARSPNFPRDYIFSGPPTPDMEPMDDEARAISDSFADKWRHPMDSLPGIGDFSQSLIAMFEKQMAQLPTAPLQTQSMAGVSREEFEAMKEQMAQLMARNAELEAAPAVARRV